MVRYFVYDILKPCEKEYFHECLNKNEFIGSLTYNYWVAKDYGDELEDLTKILNDFEQNKNNDELINGFVYCKLTNTPLEDYFEL